MTVAEVELQRGEGDDGGWVGWCGYDGGVVIA